MATILPSLKPYVIPDETVPVAPTPSLSEGAIRYGSRILWPEGGESEGGPSDASQGGQSAPATGGNAISNFGGNVAGAIEGVVGKTTGPIGYDPDVMDVGTLGVVDDVMNIGKTDQFSVGGKYGPVGYNPVAGVPSLGFQGLPSPGPGWDVGTQINSPIGPSSDWSNPSQYDDAISGSGVATVNADNTVSFSPDAVDVSPAHTYDTSDSADTGETKIICTELHKQGLMPDDIYAADQLYGLIIAKTDPELLSGYHAWANYVVVLMKSSKAFSHLVRAIATPWSHEMAFRMGVRKKGSFFGATCMVAAYPLCRLLAKKKVTYA